MKLMIMAVGSPRDRGVASAILDYESRASRYFRLETLEVPLASGVGNDPRLIRAREAVDFYRRLPDGLDTWALTREGSAMTLPHDLARLVLAEQLYRAGTILRGEPYYMGD